LARDAPVNGLQVFEQIANGFGLVVGIGAVGNLIDDRALADRILKTLGSRTSIETTASLPATTLIG
jgi:hypothetical protein